MSDLILIILNWLKAQSFLNYTTKHNNNIIGI